MFRYIHGNGVIHKLNSTIKLVILIVLSISIFIVKNNYFLIGVSVFAGLLLLITRISFKEYFKSLKRTFYYITFIFILNILFSGLEYSLMVSCRILLMLIYTLIFSITTKTSKLIKAITNLFIPLKIFGINTKDIGIMIAICINFIPVLTHEFNNIKEAQISKGYLPKFRNIKKYAVCIFMPFITNCFKKVDEIGTSLYVKGYVE